ncbi:MAG: hypothetical protein CL763_08160 [Chloroflexi bacterium]|mgnify:CR=1 FL=1|nr:hypothetical protein [Chloroflexota bacterium]|tara:strand:+ start:1270 stop:1863 length:594 start_codon:yes stop_codon:yes gene_type:complete
MEIDFKLIDLAYQLAAQNPLNIDYNHAVQHYEDFERNTHLGRLSHTFDPAPDPSGVGYDFGDLRKDVPEFRRAEDFVDDLRDNHGINFTADVTYLIALTHNHCDCLSDYAPRGKPGRESVSTEYNRNCGAKKLYLGKWIQDDKPENLGIFGGYGIKTWRDVSIIEPNITETDARSIQEKYRQDTILAITQDGGVTLI